MIRVLGDLVGWTLVAVTTAMQDGGGHDLPTIHTLTFLRRDGRDCRTVEISAGTVGDLPPCLFTEELK